MNLYDNRAGINITGGKIQLVEIVHKDDKYFLENVDEEFFSEFLNFDEKETKFISILQNAFNELILRKPLKTDQVSFTLPLDFFKVAELPYDENLNDADIEENLKWEFSVLFPYAKPEDFVTRFFKIDKVGLRKEKKIVAVAVLRKYLRSLSKFCERNNLQLGTVDNAHLAANIAVALDDFSLQDEIYLSIYFNEKSFSTTLIKNGIPFYFKITKFKKISDLNYVLNSEINSFSKILSGNRVKKIFVSGENISDTLINQLSEAVNLDVIKLNPFKNINALPSVYNSDFYTEKFNSFASAAGIAMRRA